MILRYSPRYYADVQHFLTDREAPELDLVALRRIEDQLQQHPRIGELYRGDIRRRYLPRLRSHLYYRYRPRLQRIELLRLWPAYRLPPI